MAEHGVARCTICGGERLETWWTDGDRRVLRCTACDTRFLFPFPTRDTLAQIYSDAYYRDHYLSHAELRLGYFRERVRNLERRTAHRHVVDLGCGPGFFMKAAADAGWTVAGVDISAAAVGHAQAAGLPATVADMPAYTPPFQPGVVTMWDVIAHVPDPRAFVAAAGALLPPGGLLVMKFPYRSRAMYRAASLCAGFLPTAGLLALGSQPHHFSPASAGRLLQEAGCRLVAAETVEEIELPVTTGDSLRLRLAKAVTAMTVKTGMYRSLIVYGERLGGSRN